MNQFRSIVTALALSIMLLSSYAALLSLGWIQVNIAENVTSLRRLIVDKVIFSEREVQLAVVGSSLTALFPNDYYKDGRINLSLPGDSSLTGLEILLRAGIFPHYLVIETNTLYAGINQQFIDGIFKEPGFSLRKNIAIFRAQYRPVNVVLSIVNSLVMRDQANNNVETVDQVVLDRNLKNYLQANAELPDDQLFQRDLQRLAHLLDLFQKNGAKIIFLEMPLHPLLIDTPRQMYIRTRLKALFPRDAFPWLVPAEQRVYTVTDGLHLLYREGVAVNDLIDQLLASNRTLK